jgi:glycosyltransferase involved in cell wall biosynthesis
VAAARRRPRTVLLAEQHPWPTDGGIAMRNAANAAALARLGPLVIVGAGDRAGWLDVSPLGEHAAVGLGHPPRADATDGWAADPGGHPSDARWDAATERRWRSLLAEVRPDVVVIEQLWLHHGIAAARDASSSVVLDAHNVEADVYASIATGEATAQRTLAEEMAERTASLEAATVGRVDQVWACSERDRRGLGAGVTRVVPNAIDTSRVVLRPRARRSAEIVFPASFAYPPNVRAARTLIDEILPAFARLVGPATLSLVGRDPPRWMRRLQRGDIDVTGAVDATEPWLERASVMVVPLTEGSGTRFKALEALALGVPLVSTAKGVEGIDVVDGEHAAIATEPDQLAELAARAHRGETRAMVDAGRALVERRYSWRCVAEDIAAHVDELLDGRAYDRRRDAHSR